MGESTPLLANHGNGACSAAEPLTPGSQAAAWAKEVSTPSGTHLLDPFPGDDTLPGDITPVDEPNHDGDGTPPTERAARLRLVKVHPRQPDGKVDVLNDERGGAEQHGGAGSGEPVEEEEEEEEKCNGIKRSESQVSFSDVVESRGPPSVWASSGRSAKSKYAVDDADPGAHAKSTGPECCGSPRLRVASQKKRDPREPRLLTPQTISALPGGYDDEDRSVCCVIS